MHEWEKSDLSGAFHLCSAPLGPRVLPALGWVDPNILIDHLVKVFNPSSSCWQVHEGPMTSTKPAPSEEGIASWTRHRHFQVENKVLPWWLSLPCFVRMLTPWSWMSWLDDQLCMLGYHSFFKQLGFQWSLQNCSLPAERKRWSSFHSSHFLSSIDKYI